MCWFLFYPLYNILLVCFRSLLFFSPNGRQKANGCGWKKRYDRNFIFNKKKMVNKETKRKLANYVHVFMVLLFCFWFPAQYPVSIFAPLLKGPHFSSLNIPHQSFICASINYISHKLLSFLLLIRHHLWSSRNIIKIQTQGSRRESSVFMLID